MKIWIFCIAMLAALPAYAQEDLNSIYKGYSADTALMTQPHRGVNELGTWLSETAAGALQFRPGKANEKLTEIRPLFTEEGFKSYIEFLTYLGLYDAVQKQTLQMSSIINSAPLLIGQGASAGRYAWAYEMQATLSAAGPSGAEQSKAITLRIQIGRSPTANNPMGVLIESWQVFVDKPASAGTPNAGGQPAPKP